MFQRCIFHRHRPPVNKIFAFTAGNFALEPRHERNHPRIGTDIKIESARLPLRYSGFRISCSKEKCKEFLHEKNGRRRKRDRLGLMKQKTQE